jgi:hypothetical protein
MVSVTGRHQAGRMAFLLPLFLARLLASFSERLVLMPYPIRYPQASVSGAVRHGPMVFPAQSLLAQ